MTNSDKFNYDAFSHGQIKSKLWLCSELEKYIPENSHLAILGCWYNILGFMLLTRNNKTYSSIVGIDKDSNVVEVANKILNYWVIENARLFRNINEDVNVSNLENYNVVINCSSEHMENANWFNNIKSGSLCCIQTTNVTDPNYPWLIKNPSTDLNDFVSKYPVKKKLFLDILPIRYDGWGYDRYMLIGIK